ncbi:hypothetical protein GGR54DRAFT_650950 [Hypoxylon sp. NC1633]|nr:hypothetical protein GGR54DRAFT_650950 [Hypoxylon sp. NC1633]
MSTMDKRKLRMQILRNRRNTVFKKLDEYHKLSQAEIYTLIFINGRFYEYTTTTSAHWPPNKDIIAQQYPLPVRLKPRAINEGFSNNGKRQDVDVEKNAGNEGVS